MQKETKENQVSQEGKETKASEDCKARRVMREREACQVQQDLWEEREIKETEESLEKSGFQANLVTPGYQEFQDELDIKAIKVIQEFPG